MSFKEEQHPLTRENRAARRQAFDLPAHSLLTQPRADPAEERLRVRVGVRLEKQRDRLFTFLDHAAVEVTNNLTERELRPAVIARKLSCGHRTATGAPIPWLLKPPAGERIPCLVEDFDSTRQVFFFIYPEEDAYRVHC